MEKQTRKCKDWLQTWMNATMPVSQAPESTLFWTGLFTLACSLRRNVKISKKYLGRWECYPNLYVIFVADAGVINKSTTIGIAEDLLATIPLLRKSPEEITVPIVLEQLSKSIDSSIYMVISELGTTMEKAGLSMYTKLINAFDNRALMDEATISRGSKSVINPCVNLIAATTPEWITDNMPRSALQGGFGSRVIWLHEKKARQKRLFYNDIVKPEDIDKMMEDLRNDILYISENVAGEFILEPDAIEWMENWFQENSDPPEGAGRGIKGYYVRRPAYILKLAMLTHISYSDELVLTSKDMIRAVDLMVQIEDKIKETFKSVGKNTYILTMEDIVAYVTEQKRVTPESLRRFFKADAEPLKMQELIDGLVRMGDIQIEQIDGKTYITPGKG